MTVVEQRIKEIRREAEHYFESQGIRPTDTDLIYYIHDMMRLEDFNEENLISIIKRNI
jgi:hypothetical protein